MTQEMKDTDTFSRNTRRIIKLLMSRMPCFTSARTSKPRNMLPFSCFNAWQIGVTRKNQEEIRSALGKNTCGDDGVSFSKSETTIHDLFLLLWFPSLYLTSSLLSSPFSSLASAIVAVCISGCGVGGKKLHS